MRAGFTGISNTILNTAGLDRIRTGDILTVKILENKNGLIKAVIKGKTISLKGGKDLTPGSVIRVKTEWSGKTLFLNRLETGKSLEKMLLTAGIRPENASYALFEAARRSGLHLKEENVEILKKLLKSRGSLDRKNARIAAECIKKGIEPENIIGVFGNYHDQDQRSGQKNLLFNHLKDGNELWFIVPYSFKAEGAELTGSLRIKKNTDTGKILSFVLETEYKDKPLYFLIGNYQAADRTVRILFEGDLTTKEKSTIIRSLSEITCNLNLKFDDNIIENCMDSDNDSIWIFDGFSYSEHNAFSGVDEVV